MSKRFRQLKGEIRKSIVENDCFALRELRLNEPLGRRQYAFERDPAKIALFLEWLQKQIDNNILELYHGSQLGEGIEGAWTNMYIKTAYEKGVGRSHTELASAGYSFTESASIAASMGNILHLDRIGILYTRTFTGLKGITDEMSKQIAEILAEGMSQGSGPLEIAKKINDRVDKIGITRAKVLARTEMIRAHHHGMVMEMRNWGVVGVRVLAEWSTAGDSRVCSICRPLDGKLFTLDRAEGLIPRHAQCRCMIIPLDVTDNETMLNRLGDKNAH